MVTKSGVVSTSGLLSCDKSPSSLADETRGGGRGCMTIELLLEDLCSGQERGSEKASPCIGWFSRAFLSK